MLTRPRIIALATVSGIPVQYSWYDGTDAQALKLSRLLKRLLDDDVAPNRITVLSPRKVKQCCAALISDPQLVRITGSNIWEIAKGTNHSISYCTVSSFKGLENDFIVLTDIEELDSEWWRSVIYVGMSRARVGLHLLLRESLRETYQERLRTWLEKCDVEQENPE